MDPVVDSVEVGAMEEVEPEVDLEVERWVRVKLVVVN